jgi:hypothetical protein
MAMRLPVAHTAANCRCTRSERQTIRPPGWPLPEHLLVCTREPGLRRLVADHDCALCPFWEPVDAARAGAVQISR